MKKIPLICFLLFSFGLSINGQEKRIFHNHFINYSTENGLSQNDIESLFQDSFGFLWIGTNGGLNRFDGYSFKHYQKEIDTENTLSSNLIGGITEDSHNNIWVCTPNAGVMMFNRNSDEIVHIKNDEKSARVISNNHVVKIFIDRKDRIWLGTIDGLNVINYNYSTGEYNVQIIESDSEKGSSLNNDDITDLFEDKFGNIWVGTSRGLHRYIQSDYDSNFQFMFYDWNNQERINSIHANDTSLVISTPAEILLLPYNQVNRNNPLFTKIADITPSTIYLDQKNNIWGANGQGAFVIYEENGVLNTESFTNEWDNKNSLSNNYGTSILEDQSGMIWIGTNGGGLNLYNPKRKAFSHHQKTNKPKSLSYNKIRAIKEDELGNLWIGTEGGGLNILPQRNGRKYDNNFEHHNVNEEIRNYVYTIELVKFKGVNKAFIGTSEFSYLEVIEYNGSKLSEPKLLKGLNFGARVFSSFYDNHVLWAGTYGNGLFRIEFDEYGNVINHKNFVKNNREGSNISSNIVRSIEKDTEGNLWVGTDNGLNKLSAAQLKEASPIFITYQPDAGKIGSISYNYIMDIHTSEDGSIWIGTLGGGINKVIKGSTPSNDRFKRYTSIDGLPDNNAKSIEEDDDGNIWIGTNNGLSKLNPLTDEIVNFNLSDGLQDLEFGEIASIRLKNGDMIFGGVKGFNSFNPSFISLDSSSAPIAFTDFYLLNEKIEVGQSINDHIVLPKEINLMDQINLRHYENSFSVSFSTFHFAAPEKNKYAYQLEGFDKDWINTTSLNRVAKYTNLSPGEYTLKVKASNSDGFWNKEPILLKFSIMSPFWLTKWAMLIYWLLFGVALWFFRKFTIIANSRKNELLFEEIEKEKLEEINQHKLRFFTNISHEFRTPLTLILGIVEQLKENGQKLSYEKSNSYYDKIYRNSRVLLNLINQLLDFRKLEQGKMKVHVSKGNISNYIKSLAENFNEVARKKQIDFQFICEEEIEGYYDHDILERVMFNLLSNAFKFTEKEGEIFVMLEQQKDTKLLTLKIQDSGKGMTQEVQEHLFERFSDSKIRQGMGTGIGLSYTKGLVEHYHGNISFSSEENVGTTFLLHLPTTIEYFKDDEINEEPLSVEDINKDVNWLIESSDEESINNTEKSSLQKESILLVEDNEDILNFLSDQLKNKYQIQTASDGSQALELCLNGEIDLVVSDVMMPGMDGLSFCEKLKADDRINHISVILLTAKASTDSKLKSYEKGADAYIAKPFEFRVLLTRIEALLNSRKTMLAKFKKGIELSPSQIEVTSLDEKFIQRVLSYIEENIGLSEFTVEMLANECGMSQLHLNKKLKVLTGQTSNAFIRNIRLKRAAQLLSMNRHTVNEVMYEVGFIDSKYFRTCFKKEFGTTPSEYQKQQANKL
ncbi:MAG: response regulator [Reichenbachiella sp.]